MTIYGPTSVLWVLACSLGNIALAQGPQPPFPSGEIIDLTYAFDEETVFWPTEEGFVLEKGIAGRTEQGFYYVANRFRTAEHGGTHIDAPIHFSERGLTVDQIPLEQLFGIAVVVDVSAQCAANRDYQIKVTDFQQWEANHGPIPQGCIVLLRTGFGQFWPHRARYMGTAERGPEAVPLLHFPGLHPAAAQYLLQERDIKAVGLDTPSIDYGQSKGFESHVTLFEANVPAFENMANLDRLPARGFFVVALPMKIRGGSGAPLRVVAVVPD